MSNVNPSERWISVEDAISELDAALEGLNDVAESALAVEEVRRTLDAPGPEWRKLTIGRPMRPGVARVVMQTLDLSRDVYRRCEQEIRYLGEEASETPPSGCLTLAGDDVRRLNVLIALAQLAGDDHLTAPPVWRAVLEHAEAAVTKLEAAHPLDGDDLTKERGDTLHGLIGALEDAE